MKNRVRGARSGEGGEFLKAGSSEYEIPLSPVSSEFH